MPDYAGLIKYPTGSDIYGSGKEPQWWKDLAVTVSAEILKQVAGGRFEKASRLPGDDLNNAVAPGQYPYWTGTLNTPGGSGVAYVSTLLTEGGAVAQVNQLALTGGGAPELHTRFRGSVGWSGWTRIDVGAIDLSALGGGGSGASPAAFKTVPLALTVGGGGSAGPTSGAYRMPIRFGATITRWRAHFRNNNPRFGTDGPAAAISSVWFGPASNGQFAGAPAQVSGATTTNGGEAVTPWQSTPIAAGTEYALSYQFSATSTNQVVGGGWSSNTVNGTSATLTRVVNMPLDVWIEAEVSPEVPVIAAFGDSLSSGVGATLPVYDSWLSQWARSNGALPVHYAASGDTMAGWGDSNAYKWQRWQNLTRPDAVIHAMGSNDVFGGASLAALQARRAVSIGQLQKLVSPVIYTATITPRTSTPPGTQEQTRRDYNAWLKTSPDDARDLFDFVPAISSDDENIAPGVDADGIHLTTVGYRDLAATITRPLAPTPPSGGGSTAWADVTGKPLDFPPTAHSHTGVSNGAYAWSITSAGAIAANAGGSNTWQIDANTGRLIAGEVPWARLSGAPDIAALTYDSGLRDITSLAGDKITAGKIYLRRTYRTITLEFRDVRPSATLGSGSTLFTVPTGFRKQIRWDGWLPVGVAAVAQPDDAAGDPRPDVTGLMQGRSAFVFPAGGFGIWAPSTTDNYRCDLTWITNDPIPTTPPGSAA